MSQDLVYIETVGASGVATLVAPFPCEVVEARVTGATAAAVITFKNGSTNSPAGTATCSGGAVNKTFLAGIAGTNGGQYRTCQAGGTTGANTGPFTGTLTSIQQSNTTSNGFSVPSPTVPADVPVLVAAKGDTLTANSSGGTDTQRVGWVVLKK